MLSSKSNDMKSSLQIKKKEKERSKAKIYKRKVPHEAIRLFGKEFQLKLCELLCSDGLKAIDELKAIHGELISFYNEHNLTEMWIPDQFDYDDDNDNDSDMKEIKAPLSRRLHHDAKIDARPIGIARKSQAEDKYKQSQIQLPASIVSANILFELSDDSDDEFSNAISSASKIYKVCF
ncbi:unnamed protein product [Dracunculus medinensis]|uniref:Uncharacterized protein n=1 Tax=Dracunculus medinensis TaxID=318479 RepID=A0A0N4UR00_DRAME|nr:unnamed protein product [Dracunculus medinensis]